VILGFIVGIGIAYLLTFLHIDHTIIAGVRDLININIGQSGYYLMMGVVGGISRVMIGGVLSGLVVAYLFTFVKLDHIIIDGLKEWFKYDMTTGGYFLLFAIIGAVMSFLKVVRMFLSPLFFIAGTKKEKSSHW
jgi:hypothetical protein